MLGGDERIVSPSCLLIDTGAKQPIPFACAQFDRERHFLHVRGFRAPTDPVKPRRITVLTGSCLFSNQTHWFINDTGQRVEMLGTREIRQDHPIVIVGADDDLSVYELESAGRLCRVVADIVAAVGNDIIADIIIDVPHVQYYCSLLDAFTDGMIDSTLVLEWFDLVDRRSRKVVEFYAELLTHVLSDVGVEFTLTYSDPLAALAGPMRDAVAAQVAPGADSLSAILLDSGDPMWRRLLTTHSPKTASALARASYVVNQLQSSCGTRSSTPDLVLQIENYGEWRILNETHQLLTTLNQAGKGFEHPPILGIYPMERLLAVDELGQWRNLFYHDPGHHATDLIGNRIDLRAHIEEIYRSPT
ncbi:hypothetical protein ACFYO1_03320 [Nocardia sp. NPDC006044]|uniref:hypothetical protein n=1 Tax=Nocardia sp. NPDC006044 TaxID=3364306 RepID=UPI00368EB98D